MEVSLILRVLPRYIISGVTIIFPFYSLNIGLIIHLHFHFPKIGIATYLLLLLYGLTYPPKLFIYISVHWHNHLTVV